MCVERQRAAAGLRARKNFSTKESSIINQAIKIPVAHHTPLLKIPVWWRRRAVLPSLPWVVRILSFFLSLKFLCGGGVPSSHPSLGCCFLLSQPQAEKHTD